MRRTACALLSLILLLPACAFHTEARHWNGRVDPEGQPIYFASTTKVGVRLFVLIPLFGDLGIEGIVEDLTDFIAERGGDGVTMVETSSESYWYLLFPLTYLFTPVVSTVGATYRPSAAQLAADLAELLEESDEFEPPEPESEVHGPDAAAPDASGA